MKTKHSHTLMFYAFTLFTLHAAFSLTAQAQHRVQGQDSVFALYSQIDTLQWKQYNAAFDFDKIDLNRIYALRKTIQAYLSAQDPLGEFL
jgi:hypothetical protein